MSPAPAPAVYTLSLEEIAPHCYNIQTDGFYLLCLMKDLRELVITRSPVCQNLVTLWLRDRKQAPFFYFA